MPSSTYKGQRQSYRREHIVAAILSLAFSSQAFASGLLAPFSLDSAAVVPKGVRGFRISGFSTEVDNRFDGYGNNVPAGYSLSQSVTWKQLVNALPSGHSRDELNGGLRSYGYNLNDTIGNTYGSVDVRVTTTVPVFAYGITDKLMAAVGVPIIYSSLNVSTGWQANSYMQNAINNLEKRGQYNTLLSHKQQLVNVAATEMQLEGYEPLTDTSNTDLGDMNFIAKYQHYRSANFAMATVPRIIAPTGRTPDVNKVIDLAPGSGHWDLGLGENIDYYATGKTTFTYAVSYLYQMDSYQAERIPTSTAETLTPDVDPNTHVKDGDIISTGIGVKYAVHPLWTLGTEYSFQYKAPDQYGGGMYSPERYGYMSNDTEETMQAGVLAVSFSTIPLYKAHQFEVPMEITLAYAAVLAGKNINDIDLTSIELGAFF